MKQKRKRKNKKSNGISKLIFLIIIIFAIVLILKSNQTQNNPEDTLKTYMSYILDKNYEGMYHLLSEETKKNVDKETYLARNKNIYEGIEISDLKINIVKTNKKDTKAEIIYQVKMQTVAGEIEFSNTSYLSKNVNDEYRLNWSSSDIFPELKENYKIRVDTIEADRGKIIDRDGTILAGNQTASEVGLVPGKMNGETKENDIKKIADLLEISSETITNEISASYVTDNTFVPLKKIRKSEQSLKNQLLEIKGIKIVDTEERIYPLGEATSHLVGYIQSISKEELEENKTKGYNEHSVIGKTGIEKIYEDRLRAVNGAEIYIIDDSGNKTKTLAKVNSKNGEDIKLTIDSNLQKTIYEQFENDKSAHVAINPKTGEILALVSTPTFDSNDFSLGMSETKWNELTNNEKNPLFNRYLASYVPGSSIKPITGAIGLTLGSFTKDDDFERSGTKWQKDSSWKDFYITTLETYSETANLQNALIYSDNIYFAKAALKIGKEDFTKSLKEIGFNEKIDFTQEISKSIYSNTDAISDEKQLANSGYGQAEMLVNPIHMAMIYSSFINDGNMIMPYWEYKANIQPEYYKQQVFSKDAVDIIKESLIQVVENPNGTGYNAKVQGLTIAGKTGTGEIKESKDDKNGTEIGWFDSFIVDENSDKQLLLIDMVEDVKGRGGSHYLLEKVKGIYESI